MVEGSSFSRKGSTDTEDELDGTKGELVSAPQGDPPRKPSPSPSPAPAP